MSVQENSESLWLDVLPFPATDAHKYRRGHAVIFASGELTGATRLATTACSRIGAGLVTVISPDMAAYYRTVLPPDIMIREGLSGQVRNITCALAGPGGSTMASGLPRNAFRVLDAGALPHADEAGALDDRHILTPHDGEFEKCFPDLTGTRAEMAVAAAQMTGAYMVLKGPETIIAAPNGRTIVNRHTTRFLAKAGTGDVLAGMITGLLAQMAADNEKPRTALPILEVLAAAVWIHGECGRRIGPGLVAGDLETVLPAVLGDLYQRAQNNR